MYEANLELVRSLYAAPDFWSLRDRIAPDAEFDFSDLYPDTPVIRGVDELRRFREESWRGLVHFEPQRFVAIDGERVLVLVRTSATGKATGAKVGGRAAHEITIHGGQVVRVKVHPDPDEALREAGLSP